MHKRGIDTFLEVWGQKWADLPFDATVQERRDWFEVIAKEMRLPTPDSVETTQEIWIQSEPVDVRVRVFRYGDDNAQPCLIYLHGGAWMVGSPETHWDVTSRIAKYNKQTVISIDYALAPEHPYPAAITQCEAVVKWVHENASNLNINPNKIAVGGDSAGANLAALLTIIFRDSHIKLVGQLLYYPAVDFEMTRPAYVENANGPILSVAGMPAVNAMYCPNARDLQNPLVAPMLAHDHSNLPPAYIAVAHNDPLRDDGIDYAEKLRASGVDVELDLGEGLIHSFLRAMEYCEASRDNLKAASAWLRKLNEK